MKLYYLTRLEYAISNLALKRIKISRILDLNDPFELMSVKFTDQNHKIIFQQNKSNINDKYGVICFTEIFENPVMWGHYADKHRGVALGFEIKDKLLFKVSYTNNRSDLPINPITKCVDFDEQGLYKLLSTKFYDWQYEKEQRVICTLSETIAESGLYFEKFSEEIKPVEVILGEKCELSISTTQSFVDCNYGINSIKVYKAKISDDTFQIVCA